MAPQDETTDPSPETDSTETDSQGAFGLPDKGSFEATTIERALALLVMALMVSGLAFALWMVVRYWGTTEV